MEEIRVRFPPSPTGYLHIGGARTVLYNWLFARKHGGKLVLRIEDTDTARSTEASTQAILDGLRWMGLDWDEGPYNQSDHAAEHRAAAETLVKSGAAYRCYCTKDELAAKRDAAMAAKQAFIGYDRSCRALSDERRAAYEAEGRQSVVRFRVPIERDEIAVEDLIYGRTVFPPSEMEDFVIVRSNGEPLYVLSNAVDDHRDRISHVIRGADHRNNTAKQVLLYEALGWEVPTFAHIPLTLDPQKAKISKRKHGEVVAVGFYQDAGFLPWAFSNYIALLGWSPGDDKEIFASREEMMEAFTLERVKRTNSVFNYRKGDPKFITDAKALHINAEHLRTMPVEALAGHVAEKLDAAGIWNDAWSEGGAERAWFLATLDLVRDRYHLLNDFIDRGRAYFSDDFEIEPKAMTKSLRKDPALKDYLPQLADRYEALASFDLESTERALRELCEELGVKAGLLINGARAAVSGQSVGPGAFDLLVAIGQARTVARLRKTAALLAQ